MFVVTTTEVDPHTYVYQTCLYARSKSCQVQHEDQKVITNALPETGSYIAGAVFSCRVTRSQSERTLILR